MTELADRRIAQDSRLMGKMRAADYARLAPLLERVHLSRGQTLWRPGAIVKHVYFPIDCIISLSHTMNTGVSIQIVAIGNEGMLGSSVLMGFDRAPDTATVDRAGQAYRLGCEALRREAAQSDALRDLLLRYVQASMRQIMQYVACNRFHSVEQQLCRLLLSTLDQIRQDRISVTHEALAESLGVMRSGVPVAIGKLRAARLISCRRGGIIVLNRAGLAQHSCECYAAVRNEFDQLRS